MSYHTSNDLNNILRTLDSIHNISIPSVVDSLLESHPSHPEAEKHVERGPKLVGLIGADTKSNKAALHAQASEESMRSDAEERRELLSEATAKRSMQTSNLLKSTFNGTISFRSPTSPFAVAHHCNQPSSIEFTLSRRCGW
jgi:hypothetical protein